MNPGPHDRMIHGERYSAEARADMTLSLAALAAGEVPWIAWEIDGRKILILSDDFDAQIRAGILPEVPPYLEDAVLFSLSMFREAVVCAGRPRRPPSDETGDTKGSMET